MRLSGRVGTDTENFAVARSLYKDKAVLYVKVGLNNKAKRTPEVTQVTQDLSSTEKKKVQ